MSGPEVANTPGGGAPGKEGKEPVANGHAGESPDANPFAEYMWMENEEEYNRQVRPRKALSLWGRPARFFGPSGRTELFELFVSSVLDLLPCLGWLSRLGAAPAVGQTASRFCSEQFG